VLGALYWAASQLNLPARADSGYEGAGHGVYTPIKQPADGKNLAVDNRAYNLLLRSTRCQGERGFALLTQRWQNPATHHRQPQQHRRLRQSGPRPHPFRTPLPTDSLLRSPQWILPQGTRCVLTNFDNAAFGPGPGNLATVGRRSAAR